MSDEINLPEALRDARLLKRFITPLLQAEAVIEASIHASHMVAMDQNTLINLQDQQRQTHEAITSLEASLAAERQHYTEVTDKLAADYEAAKVKHDNEMVELNVALANYRQAVEDARKDGEVAIGQAMALAAAEVKSYEDATAARKEVLAAEVMDLEAKKLALLADLEALRVKHLNA